MNDLPITFSSVQQAYDKALLLADREIVRLMAASVIANQIKGNPVWLMLVASSSGGKTALLTTLDGLEFVPGIPHTTFISDLTENTFASGYKGGKESASLLERMPFGGIMIFKDFTSMLTKRKEARDVVMGQLREIYDGRYDKRTGNQQDTTWKGQVGALAGVTEAVHEYLPEMSAMGDRFMLYSPRMPNRKALLDFVMDMKSNNESQVDYLLEARERMHRYLRAVNMCISDVPLLIQKDDRAHLMEVCDFVTKTRSGVIEDMRTGSVRFVPSAEMPTRIIDQLLSIARAFCVMRTYDGLEPTLDDNDMSVLYKIAFDSIPLKRMWALRQIASYSFGVTSAGVGQQIGYESEIVRQWMAQLAALGIVHKVPNANKDLWKLNYEYVEIMKTYQHVEVKEEELHETSEGNSDDWLITQRINNPY